MSIAARIADFQQSSEVTRRAAEFLQVARALLAEPNVYQAREFLKKVRASDGAREMFEHRAITQPGTSTDSTWAAPLAQYSLASDAFAETLRNASAFDRVLGDGAFLRVPALTTIAITVAGATAVIVGETGPKAASALSFTNANVVMSKVQVFVVLSAELMKASGSGPIQMVGRELRGGLAQVTDAYLIQQLLTGLTPIPSAGSNSVAIRNDVRDLLDSVQISATSKLYYLTSAQIGKRLSVVGDSAGSRMFPQMSPSGGFLDGVPCLISDAPALAGSLVLFDASQVAVSAGLIELDRSDVAMLNLDSAPDSPPVASTSYVNLYTQNMSALRAERFLGAQRLRSTAAASVSGFTGVGSSPA